MSESFEFILQSSVALLGSNMAWFSDWNIVPKLIVTILWFNVALYSFFSCEKDIAWERLLKITQKRK